MMDADTNQSGAKRNTGGSRMSGTVNAPAFGMSIPSSVYPKDSVKDVAESLGITNLRENVAVALAADIEYRIRDIAQSASKYMRHSKRTQMTTADVDAALREKNVEPLYGFFPPYTTGRSKGPWFRSVQSASGQPLQVMEDEEIDFEKVLESGPEVGIGRGVGWHAHWLAIEGIQPPVPENPLFLARRPGVADVPEPDAGSSTDTVVKPLVKHVLSRELQLYYERLTSSILNPPADANEPKHDTPAQGAAPSEPEALAQYSNSTSGNLVRDAALASLRGDAGIHQLVPYLIQWTGANIMHALRMRGKSNREDGASEPSQSIQLLHIMLSTLHALLVNPSIFIEPYLHQLMPSVLSVLLATYAVQQTGSVDAGVEKQAFELRVYAATLLAFVIEHFADYYPTLKPRVVATLLQALLVEVDDGNATKPEQASGSLDAKLGALIGLRRLGPASFKTLLGRIGMLPPMDINSAEVSNRGSQGEEQDGRIPLQVLGGWLQRCMPEGSREAILVESMLREIRAGLEALGAWAAASDGDVNPPSKNDLDALTQTYGAYWTQDVFSKDSAALTALLRHRSLAERDS